MEKLKKNVRGSAVQNSLDQGHIVDVLQDQIISYEKEKNILLALSNDITMVREKRMT